MNSRMPVVEFRLGDVIELRKPHPCGSHVWGVVRLGADIGIKCTKCGRRVLLPRSTVEQRMKRFVERGAETGPADPPPATPDAAS